MKFISRTLNYSCCFHILQHKMKKEHYKITLPASGMKECDILPISQASWVLMRHQVDTICLTLTCVTCPPQLPIPPWMSRLHMITQSVHQLTNQSLNQSMKYQPKRGTRKSAIAVFSTRFSCIRPREKYKYNTEVAYLEPAKVLAGCCPCGLYLQASRLPFWYIAQDQIVISATLTETGDRFSNQGRQKWQYYCVEYALGQGKPSNLVVGMDFRSFCEAKSLWNAFGQVDLEVSCPKDKWVWKSQSQPANAVTTY